MRSGALEEMIALLRGRRPLVLTGAGCSTESGIPDYRGPETRRRARNPIQYKEFVGDEARRRRYWARSVLGWPRFVTAQPNRAHAALAQLERRGLLTGIVTQNVDRLHHKAGSEAVVELHGALADVRCLQCGVVCARGALQSRLLALNPGFGERGAELAPDGDAELEEAAGERFQVAPCAACGGVLKPDVVFFGENVPRAVYDQANAWLARADALLVVGSSLAVYSGLRFVREAARRALPVGMINLGPPERGAEWIDVMWDANAGDALPALAQALGAPSGG